ncbi:hypothetical protein CEXT_510411 [Caerostris extrusa]|uniref:Uncharacterized protein n=1 Tax=Caerostris extrusa TaxID=172846 RepID=A0AAV4WXM2_CAEEX|nr:hypothetical protein CEXT_510411 [Caerostris extrusa]
MCNTDLYLVHIFDLFYFVLCTLPSMNFIKQLIMCHYSPCTTQIDQEISFLPCTTKTLHPSKDRESSQPTPHLVVHLLLASRGRDLFSKSSKILGEKSSVDLEPEHKVCFLRESLKVFEVYSDVQSWKIVPPHLSFFNLHRFSTSSLIPLPSILIPVSSNVRVPATRMSPKYSNLVH